MELIIPGFHTAKLYHTHSLDCQVVRSFSKSDKSRSIYLRKLLIHLKIV